MIDNTQPPLSGTIDPALFRKLVHAGSIRWAGNRKLKIYGRLDCPSGKRMKKMNRVFFSSEEQAVQLGFRPCARCLQKDYSKWKAARSLLIEHFSFAQ
jgi:methylphosphotriester-DNA--protein-cysteine methyltransferase